MWIRTTIGYIFIEIERTSQGLLVPKQVKTDDKLKPNLKSNF